MSNQEEQPFSGFINILVQAGFTLALASAISAAVQEDERILELIEDDKTPLIFMTQRDAKVDDKICLPLEGTVWDTGDTNKPQIPATTHPNCRCFWINAVTGRNMGQF